MLAFYARRARRILPASLVILVVTLGASWLVLAPLDLPRVAGDVAARALSVGNIRFATEAADYFGSDKVPSPVLHYWSLGVEEQFYLVWPAILILASRVRRPVTAITITLLSLVLASFVASAWLTDASPAWVFYSLPTRAWELGLGGLLAVTATRQARLPSALEVPLGWAGLTAVIASLVVITPDVPYPGLAALLPALGTTAVILAGARPGSVGVVLRAAPLRFLGLICVAILLGWGSYAWIERPFHRGLRMSLPPHRVLSVAASAVAVTVVVAMAAGQLAVADVASAVSDVGSGPGAGAVDGVADVLLAGGKNAVGDVKGSPAPDGAPDGGGP